MDIQAIVGASSALDQAQLETEMHAREASVAALRSEMREIRKLWEPIEVAQQNKKLSVSGALPLTLGVGNLKIGQSQ